MWSLLSDWLCVSELSCCWSLQILRQVQVYRVSDRFRSTESLRQAQVYRESHTGSGPQRVSDRFRSTESLRQVQVHRESQTGSGPQRVSVRFRSTESLRQVQVYRESQSGSGLQRVSVRFRSTKCLRQVQVYRESQTGSGLQRAVMMMMKMMKVLVLGLSWVLWVSADVLHEDFAIIGCSDSDGELMYGLDGEELWYADYINRRGVEPQPPFIDHISYPEGTYQGAEAQLQVCQANLKTFLDALKNPAVKLKRPSSPMVYTRDDVELGEKNHLICHVTGFYPAPVKIDWTKNGEKVTEGTSINVPYYNRDGYFSQTSRLEFTPQQGDIYSCTVQHPALDRPLTRIWDVETTPPSVGPAVFCGLGLTVGLLGVAAGTFFLIKGNECS